MICKAVLHLSLWICALSAVPNPPNRRSCAPFVSGDAFRGYADYAFDELTKELNPLSVTFGQTIFVKTDYLEEFFTQIHPQIQAPYILITHNSDYGVPGSFHPYLEDPKLLAWFGQNYDGRPHPKMHPIPIGIANFMWAHGNPKILEKAMEHKPPPKSHLLYLNFDINTFRQERWPLYKELSASSFCYRSKKQNFEGYLNITAASQFIASPRGNGLDTHRLWEALYMGAIPIVKTSSLDSLYEGLPVLIVSDWSQVTEPFLLQTYEDFQKRHFPLDKIWMDYWIKRIDSCKKEP